MFLFTFFIVFNLICYVVVAVDKFCDYCVQSIVSVVKKMQIEKETFFLGGKEDSFLLCVGTLLHLKFMYCVWWVKIKVVLSLVLLELEFLCSKELFLCKKNWIQTIALIQFFANSWNWMSTGIGLEKAFF